MKSFLNFTFSFNFANEISFELWKIKKIHNMLTRKIKLLRKFYKCSECVKNYKNFFEIDLNCNWTQTLRQIVYKKQESKVMDFLVNTFLETENILACDKHIINNVKFAILNKKIHEIQKLHFKTSDNS